MTRKGPAVHFGPRPTVIGMAATLDEIREGPFAWANRCAHCTRKATTTIKLGNWQLNGFERLHRWIAGGRAECGLRARHD